MSLLARFSSEIEELAIRVSRSVASVLHKKGHGSAVILSRDGLLVTNDHVLADRKADEIRVGLPPGSEPRAEVLGRDPRSDLALLRVDTDALPALPLREDPPRIGQIVLAMGNPLHLNRSLSLGVLSAVERSLNGRRGDLLEGLLQTDAAINPGNSGGPLLDVEGRVLGINTAMMRFAQGLAFAIPARTVAWVAAILASRGEVRRPFFGLRAHGAELAANDAMIAGQARAVRVLSVGDGSPAARAGLRGGDALIRAAGQGLGSVDDLGRAFVLAGILEAEIVVLRRGELLRREVRPHVA